ncbi:MAG TPA: emopamil-binding family protein [Nocardioidaceae bacterium]|jgi:hypothetical protein
MGEVTRQVVPLRRRPLDIAFVAFFAVNLGFVTYIVDLESLVISDPDHFRYPLWPPPPLVDLVHWWGREFDPLLMARPAFWRMTIWIDVLLFGPFYVAAIYAFVKGKEWIRPFAFVWAGMMLSNVLIILLEEADGIYATPRFGIVFLANLAWLVMPILLIARFLRTPHPFTEPVAAPLVAEPEAVRS